MYLPLQVVEKEVKDKLMPLFEEWRADALGQNVPWSKAGDVVRAMRKTLDTCELERRGEIKIHPEGTHFLADDGRSKGGEHSLRKIVPRTQRCHSVRANTNLRIVLPVLWRCVLCRLPHERPGRHGREVQDSRIPD